MRQSPLAERALAPSALISAKDIAAYDRVRAHVTAELDRLQSLEEDWDGEGGIATDPAAASKALEIVDLVVERVIERGIRWVMPGISPTGDGGVDMSWDVSDANVYLIIYANEVVVVSTPAGALPTREVDSPGDAAEKVVAALASA